MCFNPFIYDTVKKKIVFYADRSDISDNDYLMFKYDKTGKKDGFILIPCGHCLECEANYAREWSYRCMNELKNTGKGAFITLTYENAPEYLVKRDYQLFLKRLRKLIPEQIRYFGCGEYGEEKGRPHFHIAIFGYDFPDKYFWSYSKKKIPNFRSPTLEKAWSIDGKSIGFSTIEDLGLESCMYCAKYMQKQNPEYESLVVKPFTFMSRRPGIGYNFINESLVESDKIYVDGHYIKLPRYYLKILEQQGVDLSALRAKRERKARILESTQADLIERKQKFLDFIEKK